jgi:hypothetical protein
MDNQPEVGQSPEIGEKEPESALKEKISAQAAGIVAGMLGSLLFLAPLALIFDLVGYITPAIRLFLIYCLLAIPFCRWPKARLMRGVPVLLLVIVANSALSLPAPAQILLLVFVHLWIWSLAGVASPALVQGIAFYTLLHIYLFFSPLGYQVLESLSDFSATVSGWITGASLNLGYTYYNIGSLLLFLCLSIHAWDRSAISKLRTGAFLVVALLLNAFLSAFLIYKVNTAPDLTWELKFRDAFDLPVLWGYLSNLALLVYPALVCLVHAIAYLFLHHDVRKGPGDPAEEMTVKPGMWTAKRTLIFTASALVLFLLVIPPVAFRKASPHRLVFLEKGVVSFTKPDYTRFGRAAGGMYGFFPEYSRLFGCESVVVQEIPEKLDPDQILITTNLDVPLTPEESERLWSFVRAGGGLWVLGDHTFIKNGRNHINDLLEPTNILFNNDSAQFWPQGWFNSYRIRQGTAFASLQDPAENRLSILVGASLELKPPARPLVMGRFAYGDWGTDDDVEDKGHLGDFEYQTTERLGDLVLVAGEHVGKGKVLVFGDTTSFFNNNLNRSNEILRSALTWFGEPARYAWFNGKTIGILSILGVLALLVVSLMARETAAPATLAVLAVFSLIAHRPAGLISIDQNVGREKLAIFDFSQHPYASKHGSMGEALYGLSISFLRYGLLPVTQNHWNRELLDNAKFLYLNAPRQSFSASRRKDIMDFMERGGVVIMGCGAHHYANSRSLLEPLGLSIRNLPLGRFFDRPAFNQPIQYFSAWPIEVDNPDATVVSLYGDWPLMVDVPVGNGRLFLVADSEFFHNKNLESHEAFSQQNIQFVRTMLDFVTGSRPSDEGAAP